jgi:ABC-type lipoprotein release transport system permease subunit
MSDGISSWANRQLNILDFTLSSLLRRKGRNLSLFVVYTAVVAVLASVMFFTHSIKEEAAVLLDDAPEILVQRMQAGRHALVPADYVRKLKGMRGVSSVRGRLWGYYFDPVVGANYTLMVPYEEDLRLPPPGSIIIGSGISRSRPLLLGERISLRTHDGGTLALKVKDVFEPESALVAADLMLVSEEDFRSLFGTPEGFVTDIALEVRNKRELATIAGKIVEMLPGTRPIIRDEIKRTYDAVFNWRGGMMAVVLFAAVLAFVIFAWDRASGLSAEEKWEIGVLKATGWETSDVLLMKFWEGTVISLSAFLAGVVLAYIHVFFANSALFEPALKGWATLYPDFRLVPYVSPHQIFALFFLTVMPYTVATIVPSWRAATVDPDSIMRT